MLAFFFIANYTLSFISLFLLRRREPERPRPYRAWGYPWTTALALFGSVAFLAGAIAGDTRNSVLAAAPARRQLSGLSHDENGKTTGGEMTPPVGVLQRLRQLCLSLPETSERSSWGHPNFRAGKKTFAAFERVKGRPSIAFRLDRPDVDRLMRRKMFFATPYGRGLWISVWADVPLDWHAISDLLERSYRVVALKRMIAALDSKRGVAEDL